MLKSCEKEVKRSFQRIKGTMMLARPPMEPFNYAFIAGATNDASTIGTSWFLATSSCCS